MKITVIGAGAIGSAVAYDLVLREEITQVQVCDVSIYALEALKRRIRSPKLRTFQIDARNRHVLEPVARGSECIVSCVSPELNPDLARMALDLGSHFCDLGGSEEIVAEELRLAEEAVEKNVWIVPNCGLAPGLVNILCMHGMEAFDAVYEVRVRVGTLPLEKNPPFNFRLAFSAEKLLEDYTTPATLIEDGEVRQVEPLTALEEVCFPEPFGRLEAFHTSGGLSTLPYDLEGKVHLLDYKTLRYPGHAHQMQFVIALGLADRRHIDVRTHLTYRDVLVRLLKRKLGGHFEDAVLMRIAMTGRRDGEEATLVYEMIDYYDRELEMNAIQRCTAFPAAVVAYLVASGAVPGGGAAPPERIVPRQYFFELIKERKLDIRKQWLPGLVDARCPVDGP